MSNKPGTSASTKSIRNPEVLIIPCHGAAEDDQKAIDRATSKTMARPEVTAAMAMQNLERIPGGEPQDLMSIVEELEEQAKAVNAGSLQRGEAMLMSQAHTLDVLFSKLLRRGLANQGEYLQAAETYMKLALRAQAQCRSTIEALAEMKNPKPLAFVQQANIANGPQQVNNGAQPLRGEELESRPNELLEQHYGKGLDTRAQAPAVRTDSELAPVGSLDRTTHGSR